MDDEDFLYIFLHIPKCGGSTFMRQLLYNYPRRESFELPGVSHFDHRADVDNRIESLGAHRRDQIRFLCGHSVYYGIHEHFKREPRYITFLRDPVDRAVSNFNWFMKTHDGASDADKERFGWNREEITFEGWWKKFQHNFEVAVILNYQVEDTPGWDHDLELSEVHLNEAKSILDKFFFVGLTEKLDYDSLYLYSVMNCDRVIKKRQNVTGEKYVDLDDDVRSLISPDMSLDLELYEHAVKLNSEFKERHPEFSESVERMRMNRRYVIPIKYMIVEELQSLIGIKRAMFLVPRLARIVGPINRVFR